MEEEEFRAVWWCAVYRYIHHVQRGGPGKVDHPYITTALLGLQYQRTQGTDSYSINILQQAISISYNIIPIIVRHQAY